MVSSSSSTDDDAEESLRASAVKVLLDRYAAGETTAPVLEGQLCELCRQHPESTWEALSFVDQFHRRKLLPTDLFQHLKQVLQAQIFGPGARPNAALRRASDLPGASPREPLNGSAALQARAGNGKQRLPPTSAVAAIPNQPPPSVPETSTSPPDYQDLVAAEVESEPEIDDVSLEIHEVPRAQLRVAEDLEEPEIPLFPEPVSRPTESSPRSDFIAAAAKAGIGRSEERVALEAELEELRTGRVLMDRYVLLTPIVRGDRETLFKAFDRQRNDLPQHDRYVAIKILKESALASAYAANRLRSEFDCLKALDHPNFLNVFEYVEHSQPPFFVAELVTGETLARILERATPRRIATGHALAILRELAAALMYLHGRGLVHGELRPNNVLLTADGSLKVLGVRGQYFPRHITTGEEEEWAYASPQRLAGAAAEPRDDLYSLGCIAYELLTGVLPFSEADVRGQGARLVRRAGLNARRWSAIKTALAWNRERRPLDVRQWAQAFDWHGAATTVPANDEVRSIALPRTSRTARFAVAMVLAVIAMVVGGWWVWSGLSIEAPHSTADILTTKPPASPAANVTSASSPPLAATRAFTPAAGPQTRGTASPKITPADAAVASPASERPAPKNEEPPKVEVTAGSTVEAGSPETLRPAPSSRPISASFTDSNFSVPVEESVARLAIRRYGSTDRELTIHWRTIDGSARGERDFVPYRDAVEHFAPGQRNATLVIPIVNDGARRQSQWFDVQILEVDGGSLGELPKATVFILANR